MNMSNNSSESESVSVKTQEKHLVNYEVGFVHDWTLLCTRIENGLKLGEQMKLAIEERASLEELYSTGLESISSRFFPSGTESTSLSSAIISLRNETYRRSKQCRELSDTLRSDVLNNTLNSMLKNHKSAYKNLSDTGKAITVELQKRYSDFVRLRDNYGIARHNVGLLSLRYHELIKQNEIDSRVVLLGGEILRKILEVEQLEKDYSNSIDSFETYYAFYLNEIKHIVKTLEDIDKTRIKCLSDTFMKMMVYDMSYIRNLQYDSNNVINSLQDIDAEKDVLEYTNRFGELNERKCSREDESFVADLSGMNQINKVAIKKENWRDICNKMGSLKISNDEFITLTASQMAEKNIMFEDMLDLQSIISTFLNPSTAVKAQKAVKILLTQFNLLINNNDKHDENKYSTQMDGSYEDINSYVALKDHSFESSTTCSNEIIQDATQEKNDYCNENSEQNGIETSLKNLYNELIIHLLDLESTKSGNELIEKMNSIHNYGLNKYVNCDYYLNTLIEHTLKGNESKLILEINNEKLDTLLNHLFTILSFIQAEKSIALFRKMLFISEYVIVNEYELFKYVYKHDIWNVVKIWENTILLSISEQYQKKLIESDPIEFTKFKSIVNIEYYNKINNIEKLPLLMKKFGIPEIPIITLFTKICSQNGLEKSYCDKLLSNIKNMK